MLRVRIRIGTGEIVDSFNGYGFVYLDSDKRVGPGQKEFESTQYPEEEGEHINPKTVDAPFDYKVKFFVQADSVDDANDKIATFNALLHSTPTASGQKEYYQVTLFNDYKRQKIVGYPHEIEEASEFWRDPKNQLTDVIVIEWTIRVNKPSLCEWSTPFSDDIPASE